MLVDGLDGADNVGLVQRCGRLPVGVDAFVRFRCTGGGDFLLGQRVEFATFAFCVRWRNEETTVRWMFPIGRR